MLTLYFAPGSSSMAPHIALHEVGALFEARPISLAKKENRTPEYLALNPEGKVPTLLIDGRSLTEVAGILFYLATRFPEAKLLPQGDIEAEAQVVSWMSFIDHTSGAPAGSRAREERFRDCGSTSRQSRMGCRRLLYRRHSLVPALLAVLRMDASGAGRVSQSLAALRPDDGTRGGPKND